MKCIKCGKEATEVVHSESYPCSCGENTIITYNICSDCGIFWRAVNGSPVDDGIHDTKLLFGDGSELITELLNDLSDLLVASGRSDSSSMEDVVHRCIKCNALAYEADKSVYKCSKCDAEWEVIASE